MKPSGKRTGQKRTIFNAGIEPRLLTVKAAAAYLSATIWFVRTLVYTRAVPFLRFGKRILFDKADLDNYIERQKGTAA